VEFLKDEDEAGEERRGSFGYDQLKKWALPQ
jgi:hypothetical protein